MSPADPTQQANAPRVAAVPAEAFRALAWIGPMLMLLGGAIGSGELLSEPAAGARYGGALFWAVLFAVITKAFWNEAIGRVSIVTGQSFLEVCSGAGPVVAWVPWAWYAINVIKDFFLRGGIMAISGLVCYDTFGPLSAWIVPSHEWLPSLSGVSGNELSETGHVITWTFLNLTLIWLLLAAGGYRLAEAINTVLCLVLSVCLIVCAATVLPQAIGELRTGLVPRVPSRPGEMLMLVSLIGIVMSGSATMCYTAWTEERRMGLFGYTHAVGRRLTREDIEPTSGDEIERMRGWLRINRINVAASYALGALICCSTFILGIAVLGPAGVTFTGPGLARELSLMMTGILGPWAKVVFYLGTWAAIVSTIVAVLDGSPRMFVQPIRQHLPRLYAKLTFGTWQKLLMTLMLVGSFSVYVLMPDVLTLVLWLGAIDAPLVGVLILAYAYLTRHYLPKAYRSGLLWTAAMLLIGTLFLAIGTYYGCHKIQQATSTTTAATQSSDLKLQISDLRSQISDLKFQISRVQQATGPTTGATHALVTNSSTWV